jgi:hypothetical protein
VLIRSVHVTNVHAQVQQQQITQLPNDSPSAGSCRPLRMDVTSVCTQHGQQHARQTIITSQSNIDSVSLCQFFCI